MYYRVDCLDVNNGWILCFKFIKYKAKYIEFTENIANPSKAKVEELLNEIVAFLTSNESYQLGNTKHSVISRYVSHYSEQEHYPTPKLYLRLAFVDSIYQEILSSNSFFDLLENHNIYLKYFSDKNHFQVAWFDLYGQLYIFINDEDLEYFKKNSIPLSLINNQEQPTKPLNHYSESNLYKSIQLEINDYAKAYNRFEWLQNSTKLIPKGDQKTGVIGEYYGLLYARSLETYKNYEVNICENHSNPDYDIEICKKKSTKIKPEITIQVKTISSYSKTRTTTKIKDQSKINFIYLFELNIRLDVEKFWVIDLAKKTNEIMPKRIVIKGKSFDVFFNEISNKKGSNIFRDKEFVEDKTDEIKKLLKID